MDVETAAGYIVRRLLDQAGRDVDGLVGSKVPRTQACADALRCRLMTFGQFHEPWFAETGRWAELAAEVYRLGEATADLLEGADRG